MCVYVVDTGYECSERQEKTLKWFNRKDRLARKATIEAECRGIWTCKTWEAVRVCVPTYDDLT